MNVITEVEYTALKPTQKKEYIQQLYASAMEAYRDGMKDSPRNGKSQGYAFLWVSLYGKDKISKAFVKYIKEHGRLFENYRGSKKAWYFGSISNLGVYDGLRNMTNHLNGKGISCLLCDEWD